MAINGNLIFSLKFHCKLKYKTIFQVGLLQNVKFNKTLILAILNIDSNVK